MSWPKQTWKIIDGKGQWVPFKTPGRGAPKGFPDDWGEHRSSVDNSNYWDVINNPLYEAAANASGLDWDQWVEDSFAAIGEEEDYELPEEKPKYIEIRGGTGGNQTSIVPYNPRGGGAHETAARTGNFVNRDGTAYDGVDSDLKNWGIDRGKYGAVAEDLDTMQSWLTSTIKTHDLQDTPIINRGPEGSDYGIEGDIWEHYGLNKPVTSPEEMAIDYEFNLVEAKPSSAGYDTPEDYPSLNVPESTPTKRITYNKMKAESGGTYYDTWMEKKEQKDEEVRTEAKHTSYGEVKGKDRWIQNVQGIIGKDQNVSAWAKVAGVSNLNSRNDSNKIKTVFREHGGVLPT